MSTRILFFETENDFAQAVRERLASSGAEVEIVDDASIGIASAEARPPSLILLTVELGRTNGFLVCKKIKKTAGLGEIPLVILSSAEDAEATFEQHRGLRYRANLYVKKPIEADALAEQLSALIPLGKPAREDATQLFSRDDIDAEIDAFAEDAFDSLFLDDSPSQEAAAPSDDLFDEEPIVEELDIDDALILDEEPAEAPRRSVPPPTPSVPPPAPVEALASPDVEALASPDVEALASPDVEPLADLLEDDEAELPAAWANEKADEFGAREDEVEADAEVKVDAEVEAESSEEEVAQADAESLEVEPAQAAEAEADEPAAGISEAPA